MRLRSLTWISSGASLHLDAGRLWPRIRPRNVGQKSKPMRGWKIGSLFGTVPDRAHPARGRAFRRRRPSPAPSSSRPMSAGSIMSWKRPGDPATASASAATASAGPGSNRQRKREWPDWTPPEQMLKRRPISRRHMEGGPENPLGARAMYLGSTFYRIHGSNEEQTIGGADSVRLHSHDQFRRHRPLSAGQDRHHGDRAAVSRAFSSEVGTGSRKENASR